MKYEDLIVPNLGKGNLVTPLKTAQRADSPVYKFVNDDERILYDVSVDGFFKTRDSGETPVSFEKAGPKEHIFFEPAKTKVGIVTCGGLCPGLNNVIRSLVNQLYYRYGINRILGIKYGYEGLIPDYNHPVVDLTPSMVSNIHLSGGTFLGTSRGEQDVGRMVDTLEILSINVLFCIGGDGTLRGAHAIHEEIHKRNLKIAVAGIPKTIDNDIDLIQKSFGFETAFSIANDIIRNAHNEAYGASNGIALVKLMGRDSGFISASAALAIQEVNFVLVPEISFDLYGPRGFLKVLRKRLEERRHAVVVVAEGPDRIFLIQPNMRETLPVTSSIKTLEFISRKRSGKNSAQIAFRIQSNTLIPATLSEARRLMPTTASSATCSLKMPFMQLSPEKPILW
jgi:6-phosphofructokinase 1